MLLVGAAMLAAMVLSGCNFKAGTGKVTGDKEDATYIVDATDNAEKKLKTGDKYRRFIKQIGSSENIAEIETTITIKTSECILTGQDDSGKATSVVVGYAFDLNKNSSDEKLTDMVLFGFRPIGTNGGQC